MDYDVNQICINVYLNLFIIFSMATMLYFAFYKPLQINSNFLVNEFNVIKTFYITCPQKKNNNQLIEVSVHYYNYKCLLTSFITDKL